MPGASEIRFEAPADQAAIRAVHASAFPTMHEADIVDALRRAGRLTLSLVTVENGAVVGHIAFSPVTLAGTIDGLGLAPVAVLPAFQRRGIAARLIRAGLDVCARQRHGFVVVLGDPRYYARFGFTPARTWGLRDAYGGGDAFQALELRPGAIPAAGGLVRYAPELG
jgi:putative acetyltransferase